jgi:hypothetical protein
MIFQASWTFGWGFYIHFYQKKKIHVKFLKLRFFNFFWFQWVQGFQALILVIIKGFQAFRVQRLEIRGYLERRFLCHISVISSSVKISCRGRVWWPFIARIWKSNSKINLKWPNMAGFTQLSDMTWAFPEHAQDMAGHMRTHMGFIKLKIGPRPTKIQTFLYCKLQNKHFKYAVILLLKKHQKWVVVFLWHEQDMAGHMWSNRGLWKVRIWPEI